MSESNFDWAMGEESEESYFIVILHCLWSMMQYKLREMRFIIIIIIQLFYSLLYYYAPAVISTPGDFGIRAHEVCQSY